MTHHHYLASTKLNELRASRELKLNAAKDQLIRTASQKSVIDFDDENSIRSDIQEFEKVRKSLKEEQEKKKKTKKKKKKKSSESGIGSGSLNTTSNKSNKSRKKSSKKKRKKKNSKDSASESSSSFTSSESTRIRSPISPRSSIGAHVSRRSSMGSYVSRRGSMNSLPTLDEDSVVLTPVIVKDTKMIQNIKTLPVLDHPWKSKETHHHSSSAAGEASGAGMSPALPDLNKDDNENGIKEKFSKQENRHNHGDFTDKERKQAQAHWQIVREYVWNRKKDNTMFNVMALLRERVHLVFNDDNDDDDEMDITKISTKDNKEIQKKERKRLDRVLKDLERHERRLMKGREKVNEEYKKHSRGIENLVMSIELTREANEDLTKRIFHSQHKLDTLSTNNVLHQVIEQRKQNHALRELLQDQEEKVAAAHKDAHSEMFDRWDDGDSSSVSFGESSYDDDDDLSHCSSSNSSTCTMTSEATESYTGGIVGIASVISMDSISNVSTVGQATGTMLLKKVELTKMAETIQANYQTIEELKEELENVRQAGKKQKMNEDIISRQKIIAEIQDRQSSEKQYWVDKIQETSELITSLNEEQRRLQARIISSEQESEPLTGNTAMEKLFITMIMH